MEPASAWCIVFALAAAVAQAFSDPNLGPGFLIFGVPAILAFYAMGAWRASAWRRSRICTAATRTWPRSGSARPRCPSWWKGNV